jgi:hypothetical protein
MKRFALCMFIAACAGGSAQRAAPSAMPEYAVSTSPGAPMAEQRGEPTPERPGLGTTYGEQVYSPVHTTPFMRSDDAPWAIALHYNDAEGTDAHAQYLGATPAPLVVPVGDGAVSVALVDDDGRTLPGFDANGRALVMGHDGERYKILVHNATTARFEVVASVDGLDVIDGQPADPSRRGYIVDPHDNLVIDGFRTSDSNVAAFRFGRVAESYAARTSGDRNVGVVGLAVFAERGARWRPVYSPSEIETRDTADPFPARGYSQPPQ